MAKSHEIMKDHYFLQVQNSKLMKIFKTIDRNITRNLLSGGIETRPVKSNGLWCCALLPAVLCIYTLLHKVTLLYKLVASVSLGLFFYSILFILFLSVSCVVLNEPLYGGCTASGMLAVLLMYLFMGQDFSFSLLCALPTLYFYNVLLRTCLVSNPKTFTVGEAMIVSQGIALFSITMAIKVFCDIGEQDEEVEFVNTIINTVLATVGLIVAALQLLADDQRNLQNLTTILIAGLLFVLLILHSVLGVGFLPKICHYVFFTNNRAQIFMFWLILTVISVLVLMARTLMAVKASTVSRKSFHVLASLVFMSGIVLDVNLIMLASGIGLGVVILIEALRKAKISPISPALQSVFDVYSDEKDVGAFAMSPLYLFVGLACPLALVPAHAGAALERLAGVLSVGVGDTAASWLGANYGFYKWKSDSNRTLEGTAFNILSQIVTLYALQLFQLLDAKNALIRAGVAAIATGLVEAFTDQVDNLILPLVSLLAFQTTYMLC